MTRLSVNISVTTEAALRYLADREQVSVTEALRRLVGYGDAVYRADVAGRKVLITGGGQPNERLVLLDEPHRLGGSS